MKIHAALLLAGMVVGWTTSTFPMQFRVDQDPEEHIALIIAEGPIVEGDAGRLEAIIPQAGRDKFGNIPLYLNSPGGLVSAAFELVKVMDHYEFSAVVSSNAMCASACASIVYVSARFHQITGSGKLGIHTCYTKEGPAAAPEPSSFCNEAIARNAVEHGTSYGAVNMWQTAYSPESMAWIGQEVACRFGLCGPPGFDGTLAVPSFDCQTAKLRSEIAICSSKRSARHEASLAKLYFETVRGMGPSERNSFRAEQRAWLKYRDTCEGDETCLLDRISAREQEIRRKNLSQNVK